MVLGIKYFSNKIVLIRHTSTSKGEKQENAANISGNIFSDFEINTLQ